MTRAEHAVGGFSWMIPVIETGCSRYYRGTGCIHLHFTVTVPGAPEIDLCAEVGRPGESGEGGHEGGVATDAPLTLLVRVEEETEDDDGWPTGISRGHIGYSRLRRLDDCHECEGCIGAPAANIYPMKDVVCGAPLRGTYAARTRRRAKCGDAPVSEARLLVSAAVRAAVDIVFETNVPRISEHMRIIVRSRPDVGVRVWDPSLRHRDIAMRCWRARDVALVSAT